MPVIWQKNYNTVEYRGGRAALKVDLGDNWTVTPTFMGQSTAANGFFGYDPAVGPLQLVHSGPENDQDSFTQTALTVEGKVSNFDITYAGAWFTRNQHSIADYSGLFLLVRQVLRIRTVLDQQCAARRSCRRSS